MNRAAAASSEPRRGCLDWSKRTRAGTSRRRRGPCPALNSPRRLGRQRGRYATWVPPRGANRVASAGRRALCTRTTLAGAVVWAVAQSAPSSGYSGKPESRSRTRPETVSLTPAWMSYLALLSSPEALVCGFVFESTA